MRVTREALLKIAQDTVKRYVRKSRSIEAAYLCGSLLGENFQLGGAADIDLVFLHREKPAMEREVLPLNDEIHLDIAHHLQSDYRYGKQVRVHPWLGPTLNSCQILHDPRHFLDFIQASVRGQFDQADYVLERTRRQLEQARNIWNNYQPYGANPVIEDPLEFVCSYVRALGHTANAIASLSGPPLPERRLLLGFKERCEVIGKPGLYFGLLGLLGWSLKPTLDFTELLHWRLTSPAGLRCVSPFPQACRPTTIAQLSRKMIAQQIPEATLCLLGTANAGKTNSSTGEYRKKAKACLKNLVLTAVPTRTPGSP